jgi:hypothetical protein
MNRKRHSPITLAEEANAADIDRPLAYTLTKRSANKNRRLKPRDIISAMSLDQHIVSRSGSDGTVLLGLTEQFSLAFADIFELMRDIAAKEIPPRIPVTKNRITKRPTVKNTGIGKIWHYLNLYRSIFQPEVQYEPSIGAFYECLERHGYLVAGFPEGHAHDAGVITSDDIDRLNKVLADIHCTLRSAAYRKKLQTAIYLRDRTLRGVQFYFENLRASNTSVKMFTYEFVLTRDKPVDLIRPKLDADSLSDLYGGIWKKYFKRLLDRLRSRKDMQACRFDWANRYQYFWTHSFGAYAGNKFTVCFTFEGDDPITDDELFTIITSIWLDVVGDKGFCTRTNKHGNRFKRALNGIIKKDDVHSWNRVYDAIEYFGYFDKLVYLKRGDCRHGFGHSAILSENRINRNREKMMNNRKGKLKGQRTLFDAVKSTPPLPKYDEASGREYPPVLVSAKDLLAMAQHAEQMTAFEHRVQRELALRRASAYSRKARRIGASTRSLNEPQVRTRTDAVDQQASTQADVSYGEPRLENVGLLDDFPLEAEPPCETLTDDDISAINEIIPLSEFEIPAECITSEPGFDMVPEDTQGDIIEGAVTPICRVLDAEKVAGQHRSVNRDNKSNVTLLKKRAVEPARRKGVVVIKVKPKNKTKHDGF